MYRTSHAVQILLVCLLAAISSVVVATAGQDEQREDAFGASAGTRELKSSGGIGAFSPPAPGFSRTGGAEAFSSTLLWPILFASLFALLF